MVKAVIQGEYHISTSDRELLSSHLTKKADALFVEQRSDHVSPDKWSLGYLTFLIGALTLYWLQALLYTGPDIQDKHDIPVHNEIDTALPDLYARIPSKWKIAAGIISATFFAAGIYIPTYSTPFISTPEIVTQAYNIIIKPVMVIGAPLIYSFLLIILEGRRLGTRDKDMAEAITEISKKKGYETIVVSCGDAHVDRLSRLLENNGVEVEIQESEHSWATWIWGN
jgi:hypothetical protein